ncbi:MAG: hypothetical protein CMJ49_07460 [Planctomycetaceae bacterium]|nr:hypothetical protein [Planctomycetaceae bacterium]
MKQTPVACVCFDIGGVLAHIAADWDEACDRADQPRIDLPHDTNWQHRLDNAFIEYEAGRLRGLTDAAETFHTIVPTHSPDQLIAVIEAVIIRPSDASVPVVQQLRAAGITTACLSNTNPLHWAILSEYQSIGLLDHHFLSFRIRAAKPEPAIYEYVEQHTGHAGPEVLFFDDKHENIAAARDRGWRAQRIDPQADHAAQVTQHLQQHQVIENGAVESALDYDAIG